MQWCWTDWNCDTSVSSISICTRHSPFRLNIPYYAEDALNTEIVSSKPQIPNVTSVCDCFPSCLFFQYIFRQVPYHCLLGIFIRAIATVVTWIIAMHLAFIPYFFLSFVLPFLHSNISAVLAIPLFYLFSFLFPFFWHLYVSFYLSVSCFLYYFSFVLPIFSNIYPSLLSLPMFQIAGKRVTTAKSSGVVQAPRR